MSKHEGGGGVGKVEDLYMVEKILDRKKTKVSFISGVFYCFLLFSVLLLLVTNSFLVLQTGYLYLIKWENYGPECNTWEPVQNLLCHEMLREFDASFTDEKRKEQENNCTENQNNRKKAKLEKNTSKSKSTLDRPAVRRDAKFEEFLAVAQGPKIHVYNDVDKESIPKDFIYIEECKYLDSVPEFDPSFLSGCSCLNCWEDRCECEKNSGSGLGSYDESGLLGITKGAIYECNMMCSCDNACSNRVIQNGRTVKLDIKRFPGEKGWGVVARENIEKGKFICEYVGEVISSQEAQKRALNYKSHESCYFFDLDYNCDEDNPCEFTIDASKYGNISHFINHSCSANIRCFPAFINNVDPRMHLVAFFAERDIKAGEEICFDYTGLNDYVLQDNSTVSRKTTIECQCGAPNCRKYVFK